MEKLLVPLDGKNWSTWRVQIKMLLINLSLWGIVDGSETQPTEAAATSTAEYLKRKNRALSTIVLAVSPSLLYLIGEPEDPRAVWMKLEGHFQSSSWANQFSLRKKLYSMKMLEGTAVCEHVRSITELFDNLTAVGDTLKERDRVMIILSSLPKKFDVLITALQSNKEIPTWEEVVEKLTAEEMRQGERISQESTALYVGRAGGNHSRFQSKKPEQCSSKQQYSKSDIVCYHCGQAGHMKRNCFQLKKSRRSTNKVNMVTSETPKGVAKSGEAGFLMREDVFCGSSGASSAHSSGWILDSGCTRHMTNNSALLTDVTSLDIPVRVHLANGEVEEASAQGNVSLKVKVSNDTRTVILYNVLLIESLAFNLISVRKAVEKNFNVIFNKNCATILNSDEEVLCSFRKFNNLFHLNGIAEPTESVNMTISNDVWHRRLGHTNEEYLKLMKRNDMASNFSYNDSKSLDICDNCILGKISRNKFPDIHMKSKVKLEVIHSDVCGPVNVKSLGGAKYFLTLTDEMSGFTWVYFLKSKSDVFGTFKNFKTMVENEHDAKIKFFRTDGGGEYCSGEFSEFLDREGIQRQLTVPKTPQQNGTSERLNRTIVDCCRSLLLESCLPYEFWAEAVATSVFIKNRRYSRAVGKTPYENLKGVKPDLGLLRTFGCLSYYHVPKDERSKFAPKGRKAIFLGYSTNRRGYRVYDQEKGKVIISRDVIFNESEIGFNSDIYFKSADEINFDLYDVLNDVDNVNDTNNDLNITEDVNRCNRDAHLMIPNDVVAQTRKSARVRQPPRRFGEWVSAACLTSEPGSYSEAVSCTESKEWLEAMNREITNMNENNVYDLIKTPENCKVINCRWVYKLKSNSVYKARLVAQGFTQVFGVDYEQTYSPVVKFESIRSLLALSVQYNLVINQMDVDCAFLNGDLDRELFMAQPEGFKVRGNFVWRLRKAIYGLKQSPRCWNNSIDKDLQQLGLTKCQYDPCIYLGSEGEMVLVALYVDDLIIAAKNYNTLNTIKNKLSNLYKVKDLGIIKNFLGIEIKLSDDGIWIGQSDYCQKVLSLFGMSDSKPVSTPMESNVKLMKSVDGDIRTDQERYCSCIGALLYLSTKTRPDLAFSVNTLSKFSSDPNEQHWCALKRVLRYVRGTCNFGIWYSKVGFAPVGYSDSDFAGDCDDRRSCSGYVFMLGGGAVSWSSKKQSCVALSTAEAEYMALSTASQEAVWLNNLVYKLNFETNVIKPVIIYEDNMSTISIANNNVISNRTKHVQIRFHYIKELINNNCINVEFCPSEEMIADVLTKALDRIKFVKFREKLGLVEIKM